jgi:uncharacterized protein GlcG (DUF336 family)
MPLTLEETQTVIIGTHEHAGKRGTQVTVAIVDVGGHLQALGRMDGAPPLSAQIAAAKAASAALFRRDGTSLRQMQQAWPAFFAQVDQIRSAGAHHGGRRVGEIEVGGWTNSYWDDELVKLQADLLFASDALLLGRVTYQGFAAAWPDMKHEEGPFAVKMNAMPKYVASQTLTDMEWNAALIVGMSPKRSPGSNATRARIC